MGNICYRLPEQTEEIIIVGLLRLRSGSGLRLQLIEAEWVIVIKGVHTPRVILHANPPIGWLWATVHVDLRRRSRGDGHWEMGRCIYRGCSIEGGQDILIVRGRCRSRSRYGCGAPRTSFKVVPELVVLASVLRFEPTAIIGFLLSLFLLQALLLFHERKVLVSGGRIE